MNNTIEKTINDIATTVAVKTIKGTSFVGIRDYKNSKGEISNQTFLVGVNHENMLKNDLETLKAFDVTPLFEEHDSEVVMKAYNELINSLVKRTSSDLSKAILRANNDDTIKRSDAQKNAYNHLTKGLKEKDGKLYIYGLMVRKEVLQKGIYPKVNSQEKTIVKNKIKKLAELRELKYKQFSLGEMETLKVQGIEI